MFNHLIIYSFLNHYRSPSKNRHLDNNPPTFFLFSRLGDMDYRIKQYKYLYKSIDDKGQNCRVGRQCHFTYFHLSI